MNQFYGILFDILIGLAASALASVLLLICNVVDWRYLLMALIPVFCIVSSSLYLMRRYRKIGLCGFRKRTSAVKQLLGAVKKTRSAADILLGREVYAFFSEEGISLLLTKAKTAKLNLLLPAPYSEATQAYNDAAGQDVSPVDPDRLLGFLKRLCAEDGQLPKGLRIGLYASPIHASFVLSDSRKGCVALRADPFGAKWPVISMRTIDGIQTYCSAFRDYFNITWRECRRFYGMSDVNRIILENDRRQGHGIVIAVTGPSGAGKTTVVSALIADRKCEVETIPTYTTRPPRPNTDESKQYKFVSREEYESMEHEHRFMVSAEFCGNRYGVTNTDAYAVLSSRKSLLLDTIANPADLKSIFGNRVMIIYLTAPTNEEAVRRLKQRGVIGTEELRRRVEYGKQQAQNAQHCDYLVVNETVEETVAAVKRIIREAKLEYLETGDVVAETILEDTSFVAISCGKLPQDEVTI